MQLLPCSGGSGERDPGGPPPSPLIWIKIEEMTEERKASRVSNQIAPSPRPSAQGLGPPLPCLFHEQLLNVLTESDEVKPETWFPFGKVVFGKIAGNVTTRVYGGGGGVLLYRRI